MNKKLSTLMVSALMLATSFGASAELDTELTNGGKYFLKTSGTAPASHDEYLMVRNDSLLLLTSHEFAKLNNIEKAAATWEISWDLTTSGYKTYTFKNAMTGKLLSVSDTTGVTLAHVEGGINNFIWKEDGMLCNYGRGGEFCITKAFTLTKEYDNSESSDQVSYYTFAQPKYGYEGPHSFMGNVDQDEYEPLAIHACSSTDDEKYKEEALKQLALAKKVVKNIDAALKKYGLSRNSTAPAKIALYKEWADNVDKIADNATTFDKVEMPENLDKYFGVEKFTSKEVVLVTCGAGIAVNVGGTVYGVISGKDEGGAGDRLMKAGLKYAAGTVFLNEYDKSGTNNYGDNYYELKFEAVSGMASTEFCNVNNEEFTINDGIGTSLITDPKKDPSYPDDFVNNFATEAGQADSTVAIQLDFTKDSDAPESDDNILEGKNLRFVVKNLLIDQYKGTSGKSDALTTSDFKSVLMIQDTLTGKYLYVSDDTYDESASSTNFKLKWVNLKDLSSKLTDQANVKTGVTYNNICADDSTALPHAGSAIFYIKFDEDSSFVIAPRFIYKNKPATADTTGATYTIVDNRNGDVNPPADAPSEIVTYYYRLGLKKFASSAFLSLVNTENNAEKEYKIYFKDDNSESGNGVRYTKATTASDVYFIQYVSQLASNKADNGKYYTADGLKNLSEYEKNNHAENQWALYTDEDDSTVVILNRATADTLEINGTAINGQKLYKGIDLKADFDSYVTLRGGDTLKITSVDSLYKNDAEIGNYVYDKEFNKVSSYEFTYYNGLDNTKKLNVDKNGNLFVDPEGESIAFTLAAVDTTYGAPAIEGKSVELKKSIYAMSTVIKDTTYYVVEKNGKYAIVKNLASYTPVVFDIQTIQAADSTIYYAFVESDRSGKVSVDDETLELFKGDLTEPRTSMFAISSETYDIYRRLGTTIEDGIAAYDTAYVQFFKMDEPNRYLYENSSNAVAGKKADGINYLGVYNKKDMAKNASIFVDTAYVANNKIMPTYMLAVDATADSASITGRYLVSLKDSAKTYNDQVRLGFVDAKHMGDSLIIARVSATAKDTIKIEAGKLNKASFAFELVDKVEKNAEADFYLKNADGYIQFVNGVPVLGEKSGAVVFNVEKTDVVPTANEEISAEGVKVIAGEGFVTIKGAEGKKVVVANILGQTIAGTVVSSDEAQIAAPAGVVVVSVEGEAAVKAVVK